MGMQDSFADAVTRAQQAAGPMWGPPTGTTMPPQVPQSPPAQAVSPGPMAVSGPGSPAEALGAAITPSAPQVHINVGAPSAQSTGDPYAGQAPYSGTPPPTDPMNPMANQLGMVDPAAYNDALTGQHNDQEMRRREFAASLSPEVSQAFAAFMNGIAEQEAMKQISAPGASRMFGG